MPRKHGSSRRTADAEVLRKRRVRGSKVARVPGSTTLDARATPTLSLPSYLTPATDANTGARLIRISDTSTGMSTQYRRHTYPKVQPWNSDGSKILLGMCYGVLNGTTYAYEKDVSSNLPSWFLWSETQPNIGYGTASGNIFQQFTMSSEAKATIYTVSGASALSFGEGEGNFSHDGRYIALTPTISSHYWVYVYDLVDDAVESTFDLGTTQPDWVSMSPSGDYVVVNWAQDEPGGTYGTRNKGVEVFSRDGTFLRQLCPGGEHGDLGFSTAGDEVLVTMAEGWKLPNSSGTAASIDMIRLSDATRTKVWPPDGDIYASHVSCRNTQRPGWAYFSTYNTSNSSMPGYDEAYALKLDGSQTAQRWGSMHHANTGTYEFQAHAVPSRDGSRVLFASGWDGASGATTVYAYVFEMPF